ncbi:hypothetical protein [Cetobacterium sp.]|uniref:hypothetical protein n=1 Tax=Cetobacterium sp. TaxID=2071632 RepID=UPI002FC5E3E4
MKRTLFIFKVLIVLIILLENLYGKDIEPLKNFTYNIIISNHENIPKRNIRIFNDLNKIKGMLSNNGENFLDTEGNVFTSWDIYMNEKKISVGSNDILDHTILELPPETSIEYKIVATPNEKILPQTIKNIVSIYEDNQLFEKRAYENNVLGSNPKITREVSLKNYSPGDFITYKITIEPDSSGYLNNYKLDENIENLLIPTLSGKSEPLLSQIEVTSNRKNFKDPIDIPAKESLIYEVKGKINNNILGDIVYKELVTKSKPYKLDVNFLNNSAYVPGKPYSFQIEIANSGQGNAGNIPLELFLEKSFVTNSKEQIVKAFPKNSENFKEKFNIGKSKKIVKTFDAYIDDLAIGDIETTLAVNNFTYTNKIVSSKPKVKIVKRIDKYLDKNKIQLLNGYTPEGYIEYYFQIKNEGLGILNNYTFNSDIDSLKTIGVNKKEILAFSSSEKTINSDKVFQNQNSLDIFPNGYIEYKIIGKVAKEAVGDIVKDNISAHMAPENITHIFKASKANYKPGDEIDYTVTLKNIGKGTAYLNRYTLAIDKASVSQSGIENRKVNPFKNSSKIEKTPIIYPGEEINYTFKGITKNNIFDAIKVDSIYGKNKKYVEINSLPGQLEFSNTLKSVNGKIITKNLKYKPGDMITYEIILKNIGEGFLNNLSVESNLNDIKALVSGSDKEESILEGINISIKSSDPRTVISSKMGDTITFIQKNIDFAPKSTITFEISGIVSDKALGNLSGLKFKINNMEKTSDEISSIGGIITGEKILLEPLNGRYKPGDKLKYTLTIENTGEGYGHSIPIEDLLSEVTTEKEGKRYGKAFSNWKVTYLGTKDNSSKFKKYTYLKNETFGKEDLKTKVDIGPKVAIEFLVEADIDSEAIGTIESKARISGGTNDNQTVFLKPISEYSEEEKKAQGVRVTLSSTKSEIKLGEVVGFTVNVENRDLTSYENLSLKNKNPNGFRYLEEEFDKFSLKPGEKYSKTFYMKATIGASIGKNIFQSFVINQNKKLSNIGETSVDVKGDSLLNTATIIGKVIDEKTKLGIPNAVVYTPSGIVVQADEYGRFHLPDQWVEKAFGENFSVKLDETSLPHGSTIVSENPLVKRISPYSLTKFNFVVQQKDSVVSQGNLSYKGTGFVDTYIGKNTESPRATYFGKGSYKDFKLTLQFDTRDKKNQTLLERLTDDEYVYYPTYGDESKIKKEVNSKGKLYLKLEQNSSYILWGNYETGFSDTKFMDYNKELYGLKGEYKNDDINVKVFISTPDTMYAHDEFLGTGGSLYFLNNGNILKDSQKVWIKIVDSNTYILEKIIYLQEGRDYEIDPFLGRILLTTPLNGGSSVDYYAYLVVDYSYIPKESELVDSSNYGLKTLKNINENLDVGMTTIHESRGKNNYDLIGVETTIKDKNGNYLRGEFSSSKGTSNISNHLSFDGGLTFQQLNVDDNSISGNAYRITGAVKLLEEAELKAWYERKEAGYSFASDLEGRFLETFGAQLEYKYSENLIGYLKLQHIDEMRWGEEKEAGNIISSKVEYLLNESTKLYGEIKSGITNILALGVEKRINDRLKINSKTAFGDLGNYFELSGDYQLFDNYNLYSGYSSDGEIDRNKYTFGQRLRVGERTNLYQESQFIKENGKNASLEGYGIDYDLKKGITIGGSIQYGNIILPNNTKSRRKSAALYLRSELKKLILKNRFEYREEVGEEEIYQYLTTNSFTYKYNNEYTFAGKINYSFTDDSYQYSYLESSVGLAYRPIYNDNLNFLSRYSVILDKDTKLFKDFSAYILEFETVYTYNDTLDISLKNGYRREKNTYLNDLYMLGFKANYTVMHSWEVYGQYQWLIDRANEDVLNGAIFGIYKNLDKNMKLGGGYNFSGFKDSLNEEDYKTSGWFLNIIGSI